MKKEFLCILLSILLSFMGKAQAILPRSDKANQEEKNSLPAVQGPNINIGDTLWHHWILGQQAALCVSFDCFNCIGGNLIIVTPNTFSPNDDDVNDSWAPQLNNQYCISDYNVAIFDRWGVPVFESSLYILGWNGKNKDGMPYSEGTYFYTMSYVDVSVKEVKKTRGFIQLVR